MQYSSKQSAFSILEVILAITVFVIFSTSAIGILVQGFKSNRQAAEITIANQYAAEGLEAARSLRNISYANLTNTVSTGLTQSGGIWAFSGPNNTFDKYTRTISVSDVFRDASGNVVETGGVLDAQTKKVTANVTWSAGYPQPQTLSQTTYLTGWRITGIPLGGMLVYGDGDTASDVMRYRMLDGFTYAWGAVGTLADIDTSSTNKAVRALRLYSSPTRNEKIMIGRFYDGTNQYVYSQVFNGSTWGNVQLLSSWSGNNFLFQINFSGTYLDNGSFMAIYSDNTTTPKARIWDGTAWSAQSSTANVGAIPSTLIAASRPGTNEVMLGVYDQSSDTNTAYYNGSAWSAATEHSTAAPSSSRKFIDFAWSQNTTTKGALIYTDANNARNMSLKIWTANGSGSGSWSAATTTANMPATLFNINVASRKDADEFMACARDSSTNLYCYKSNIIPTFSNPTNQIIATTGQTGSQVDFDVEYEGNTGTNGISVYSDNTTTPKLKKYVAGTSTWDSVATSLTALNGNMRTVRVVSTAKSDDLMILLGDSGTNLYTTLWNGTNNNVSGPVWGNTAIEGTNDSNAVGVAESFQVTANSNGTFNSITIFLANGNNSTNLVVGLYTNNGTNPGTLLTQGSSNSLTSNAWNTINVPAASVTAGTTYWVSVLSTAGIPRFRDRSGGPCTSKTSSQTNLTSLPTTWTSGSSFNTCPLSAYAGTLGGSQMTNHTANGSSNTEYWADFVWD